MRLGDPWLGSGDGFIKTKFLQKKGTLHEEYKKLRKLLAAIKKKEEEFDGTGAKSWTEVKARARRRTWQQAVAARRRAPVCRREAKATFPKPNAPPLPCCSKQSL